MKPLRLAVDTNLLLDWADQTDNVLDALTVIQERLPHTDPLVPPSALDELAFLCDSGLSQAVRQSARRAMQLLRDRPVFRPLLDLPYPTGMVEAIALEIRQKRLLPSEEVHDSFILAEAALLDCGILLTSDAHLRGIDHEALALVLNPFDLVAPVIATPREIASKFFR
ncbi:MAG: DNA-binding protein [Proteobacteria bacterium]|nr:DNA-binding protein [Pseudomonadota bacterium]